MCIWMYTHWTLFFYDGNNTEVTLKYLLWELIDNQEEGPINLIFKEYKITVQGFQKILDKFFSAETRIYETFMAIYR